MERREFPARGRRPPFVRKEQRSGMNAAVTRITVETTTAPEFLDINRGRPEARRGIESPQRARVRLLAPHDRRRRDQRERAAPPEGYGAFPRRIAPDDAYYAHNDFRRPHRAYDRRRRAQRPFALRPPAAASSETIPIIDGELMLGPWQSVFVVELDPRPRTREVIISVHGTRPGDGRRATGRRGAPRILRSRRRLRALRPDGAVALRKLQRRLTAYAAAAPPRPGSGLRFLPRHPTIWATRRTATGSRCWTSGRRN